MRWDERQREEGWGPEVYRRVRGDSASCGCDEKLARTWSEMGEMK